MNTAGLNKHRQLKPSLILSLIVIFTNPIPHLLSLDVSSRAVCTKDDRHGWTGGKCRQLFAACSGEFLPSRLVNPDEYEEDVKLFLEIYNASTKNGNCMLKMCSSQASHSVNDAHSQAFTMIYFMITYSILLL